MTSVPSTPRVLHVITGLQVGGAEQVLVRLLEESDCLASAACVLCMGRADKGLVQRLRAKNAELVILGEAGRLALPRLLVSVARTAREYRPNIVQGWMYDGNLAAWWAARVIGAKLFWNVRHSLHHWTRERRATRLIIRTGAWLSGRADQIIYNSDVARHQHSQHGFADNKAVLIPNGVSVDRFYPVQTKTSVRRALEVPEDAFVLLSVARFHPMKGHAAFLDVVRELAGVIPELHVLFVGGGNREVRDAVSAHAETLGLAGMVRIREPEGDVLRFYQAADVVVLPSQWGEAFPNVLIEAMATGVPCVATDVGDTARIVADCGRVVPSANYREMLHALTELYALGHKGREFLGLKARTRVRARWSLKKMVEAYEKLYNSNRGD